MNNTVRVLSFFITAAVFINLPGICSAQQADNTKTNQRDTIEGEMTADEQGQNESDRNISQAIRQAIVSDKSLSTYAHNVKVITNNGMVTLKGPVRSPEEKTQIENLASYHVGMNKVQSEMDIVSK